MLVLCSFANTPLKKGFHRLRNQAESFEIFDRVVFFTENELNKDFREKFKILLRPYSRGYGYWCWKPQVIAQTLQNMNDGDILLYMDLGSHLNITGKSRFLNYLELLKCSSSGIFAFRSPIHIDKKYSKMDVFRHFGVENNEFYTNTSQIEATHILLKKCDTSVSFINEWLKALYDNFTVFTDSPSGINEFPEFERNTGDQSVFSMLAKKHNIATLSTDETYSLDWSTMTGYPLLAKRDKALNHWWQEKYFGKLAKIYKILWLIRYRTIL